MDILDENISWPMLKIYLSPWNTVSDQYMMAMIAIIVIGIIEIVTEQE